MEGIFESLLLEPHPEHAEKFRIIDGDRRWTTRELCLGFTGIAAIASLPGCSPTVKSFDGKQLNLKQYAFIALYAGTDDVIRLRCDRRTEDNEGCLRGASI